MTEDYAGTLWDHPPQDSASETSLLSRITCFCSLSVFLNCLVFFFNCLDTKKQFKTIVSLITMTVRKLIAKSCSHLRSVRLCDSLGGLQVSARGQFLKQNLLNK